MAFKMSSDRMRNISSSKNMGGGGGGVSNSSNSVTDVEGFADGSTSSSSSSSPSPSAPSTPHPEYNESSHMPDDTGSVLLEDMDDVNSSNFSPNMQSDGDNPQYMISSKQEKRHTADRKYIFIGNIPHNVTTEQFYPIIAKYNPFSFRIKVNELGQSLGYAFAGFRTEEEALYAKTSLHLSKCLHNELKVYWAIPISTLYVTNVDTKLDQQEFLETFSTFGALDYKECVFINNYAFIKFQFRADAESALSNLNGTYIGDRPVKIKWSDSCDQRSSIHITFNPQDAKPGLHKLIFSKCKEFGKINHYNIPKTPMGDYQGYGFVHFKDSQKGEVATEQALKYFSENLLNGVKINCSFSKKKVAASTRKQTKSLNKHYKGGVSPGGGGGGGGGSMISNNNNIANTAAMYKGGPIGSSKKSSSSWDIETLSNFIMHQGHGSNQYVAHSGQGHSMSGNTSTGQSQPMSHPQHPHQQQQYKYSNTGNKQSKKFHQSHQHHNSQQQQQHHQQALEQQLQSLMISQQHHHHTSQGQSDTWRGQQQHSNLNQAQQQQLQPQHHVNKQSGHIFSALQMSSIPNTSATHTNSNINNSSSNSSNNTPGYRTVTPPPLPLSSTSSTPSNSLASSSNSTVNQSSFTSDVSPLGALYSPPASSLASTPRSLTGSGSSSSYSMLPMPLSPPLEPHWTTTSSSYFLNSQSQSSPPLPLPLQHSHAGLLPPVEYPSSSSSSSTVLGQLHNNNQQQQQHRQFQSSGIIGQSSPSWTSTSGLNKSLPSSFMLDDDTYQLTPSQQQQHHHHHQLQQHVLHNHTFDFPPPPPVWRSGATDNTQFHRSSSSSSSSSKPLGHSLDTMRSASIPLESSRQQIQSSSSTSNNASNSNFINNLLLQQYFQNAAASQQQQQQNDQQQGGGGGGQQHRQFN
ncbi:hypothetical protein SAMD00019534_079870 [Acytostelium subglobosum LB1]|uniref:hypothetical protein n=1 Tax=Acytostelium subglobosum LB1 TaxID=1410327 RepID=UPI000645049F|nr:hypothetical protein SAMD00019534_079870 [Acytostelium subglobosum LB1]GAM24812.1 hypothetical protein SAMD00019534_079870 [Acytostelium subglobosum LB1]|eukprot:XP_012752481.1 hypothetical protein SAMD00019534_079870 [Acytostelium subglobosum LB1]